MQHIERDEISISLLQSNEQFCQGCSSERTPSSHTIFHGNVGLCVSFIQSMCSLKKRIRCYRAWDVPFLEDEISFCASDQFRWSSRSRNSLLSMMGSFICMLGDQQWQKEFIFVFHHRICRTIIITNWIYVNFQRWQEKTKISVDQSILR